MMSGFQAGTGQVLDTMLYQADQALVETLAGFDGRE
jgi:hypothetical protein